MKILIIRLSSLGDIVLTQPVCALLKQAYPDAEIHLVCKPGFTQLPELFNPPVRAIAYQSNIAFHKELISEHYDLIIDLHGKLASIIMYLFIPAKRKLHYDKQRGLRKAIVKGDKKLSITSTIELYTACLASLGIPDKWTAPRMQASIAPPSDRYIAIFPGATHTTKRYPGEYWISVIKQNPSQKFVLMGAGNDHDLCAYIAREAGERCINQAGKYNFKELVHELRNCSLVLSGDTGPMHIAASLELPQIAIFGGTHPRLGFSPINSKAMVLCEDLPCQPCSLHGLKQCPLGHFNCMNAISPERVSKAITEMLSNV